MSDDLPTRIDIPQLIRNMGGNEKIIPKLLETFWHSCNDCWQRMDAARKANDLNTWQRTAHELKGASLSITANRIAALCAKAEKLEQLDTAESQEILSLLVKKFEFLREDLERSKASA
ncbi:MAG: Hpt domain-containing protein [Alphaproteobacteria bacterium]|nr:Hpt domain-containing protein [Alphaproteobacteria bacterium]